MPAIGQIPRRSNIINITNSDPCIVTTEEDHGFFSREQVRLTGLNGMMPIPAGEDPLNNYKFEIMKLDSVTFYLKDPITHINIDSTHFTPYNAGGSANLVQPNFFYYGDPEDEQDEVS